MKYTKFLKILIIIPILIGGLAGCGHSKDASNKSLEKKQLIDKEQLKQQEQILNNKKLKVIYKDDGPFQVGQYIIADTDTNMEYIVVMTSYGVAITPRLSKSAK